MEDRVLRIGSNGGGDNATPAERTLLAKSVKRCDHSLSSRVTAIPIERTYPLSVRVFTLGLKSQTRQTCPRGRANEATVPSFLARRIIIGEQRKEIAINRSFSRPPLTLDEHDD